MKRGSLDDGERRQPAGRGGTLGDGVSRPVVGVAVLRRQLPKSEIRPDSLPKLVRHDLELEVKSGDPCGIPRGLLETTVGVLPVVPSTVDVRAHRAGS